jgi:hypothetical protein
MGGLPIAAHDDARECRCCLREANRVVAGIRSSPTQQEMAERYGAATSVLDWRDQLVCSKCGSRQDDLVLTGTERR